MKICSGIVVTGTHVESGEEVAIKILKNLTSAQLKLVNREINMHINFIKHPNIVRLFAYCIYTEENPVTKS